MFTPQIVFPLKIVLSHHLDSFSCQSFAIVVFWRYGQVLGVVEDAGVFVRVGGVPGVETVSFGDGVQVTQEVGLAIFEGVSSGLWVGKH